MVHAVLRVQNQSRMEAVRVLLLEVPQLLREILEQVIQRQSGCELMHDAKPAFEMLTQQTLSPDVVILGLNATADAALIPALFARWPRAQVMTVTHAGDDAAVYELRPRREVLGQMSPNEMVQTLLQSVTRSRQFGKDGIS